MSRKTKVESVPEAAPIPPPVSPVKKICILGTCPSRMKAPFGDPEVQMWTIGPGGCEANRWDRLFELHGSHENHSWPDGFAGYLNFLSNIKPPQRVYTMAPIREQMMWWAHHNKKSPEDMARLIVGDWVAHEVFPKDHLLRKWKRRMWFSSSISYCIALAIEEGVTDLYVYGIDLESSEEYISQFHGAAHMLDVARMMGINIIMPEECALMRDPSPYPDRWETTIGKYIQSKSDMLSPELHKTQHEMQAINNRAHLLQGEINAFDHLRRMFIWGDHPTI